MHVQWCCSQGNGLIIHHLQLDKVHHPCPVLPPPRHPGLSIDPMLQGGILTSQSPTHRTPPVLENGLMDLQQCRGLSQTSQGMWCRPASPVRHLPRRISFNLIQSQRQDISRVQWHQMGHRLVMAWCRHNQTMLTAVHMVGIMALQQTSGRPSHSGPGHKVLASGHQTSQLILWYDNTCIKYSFSGVLNFCVSNVHIVWLALRLLSYLWCEIKNNVL